MDDVQRLFRHLVHVLAEESPARLRGPLQIADIYQNVIPYRACRNVLRFDTNQDYEMALLRLLAGEHGFVTTDPAEIQPVLQEEVASVNPNPGAFRDYAAAKALLATNAVRHVLDEREVFAPPPEGSAPATSFAPAPLTDPTPMAVPKPPPGPQPLPPPRAPAPVLSTPARPSTPGIGRTPPVPAGKAAQEPRDTGSGARCPHCFEFLPAGRAVVFCPFCGRNVKAIECPQCGEGLEPGMEVLPDLRPERHARMTPGKQANVAVIGGDGIGPEVTEAAIPVIEAAARDAGLAISWERLPYGADHYLATGETLPDHAFTHLANDVDAILLGAIGDPRVPGNEHARDILLGLRFRLDLYVNFRPCRLLHEDLCPLKVDRPIDFVIFRENTEGVYLARGSSSAVGTPQEEQIAHDVNTAPKVERILRAAFEWAARNGRKRVTMSDKSNAVPAHKLWQRLFATVSEEFPGIAREHRYVDALAMEMIREPERFDVIVTNNLFGDILSDLGAQLVGGLGLAASANLHPGRPGLYEPVHGSAPPLAGKGVANPMAAILTGALMLADLGFPKAGQRLERAVQHTIADGVRTPDIGGSARTGDVAQAIARHLATL